MGSGLDDYWDRVMRQDTIPEEFGGPAKGVTGKQYEQLEFDFDFLSDTDAQLEENAEQHQRDIWRLKNDVGNCVMQASAIITMVMDNIGEGGRNHDDHEFALWGATELLQKAMDLLE